jgi:hypothetical protein
MIGFSGEFPWVLFVLEDRGYTQLTHSRPCLRPLLPPRSESQTIPGRIAWSFVGCILLVIFNRVKKPVEISLAWGLPSSNGGR